MRKRYEGIVLGKVQGVMFRDFVRRKASKYGIVGRVWNNADGTVGFIAEGEKNKLAILLKDMQKGPPWAQVEHVSHTEHDADGQYGDFRIHLCKVRL